MGRSHWHPAYLYVVGHGSRSRLGPDLVMPTASAWLGDQHTLTRMNFWWSCEGSIIVAMICRLLEVGGSQGLMMFGRMVFGKIIGMIGVTRAPEDVELTLSGAATNPIKSHVNGLGALLLDSVIDDAACSAVVHL